MNDLFWRNEITLTNSYGGSPGDYAAALGLIQAGKVHVREMITHRLGLAETGHQLVIASSRRRHGNLARTRDSLTPDISAAYALEEVNG